MADIITSDDLPTALRTGELVDLMIAGANAKASRVAPCLTWEGAEDSETPAPSADQIAEAKLVLIGAVKRWAEAGSGALQSETAGPYSMTIDTRQRTGFNLWPSEIEQLQAICSSGADEREAFSLDTAATSGLSGHAPWCDLMFGGATCSCGYALTGSVPIYEPYEY